MARAALLLILIGLTPATALAQSAATPHGDAQLASGRYALRAYGTNGKRRPRAKLRGLLTITPAATAPSGVDLTLRLQGRPAIKRRGVKLQDDQLLFTRTDGDLRGARGVVAEEPAGSSSDGQERLSVTVLGDGFLRFRLDHATGWIEGYGCRPLAKRVLIVLSAANRLRLTDPGPDGVVTQGLHRAIVGGSTVGTGYVVRDLVRVATALRARGYAIEYATPGGAIPTVDVNMFDARSAADVAAAQRLFGRLQLSAATPRLGKQIRALLTNLSRANDGLSPKPVIRALAAVTAADRLNRYAGVFVPGGRGALVDLHADSGMAAILRHARVRSKPVGLNGHAVAALLSTLGVPWTDLRAEARAARWSFKGYKVAAFPGGLEVASEQFGIYRDAGRVGCHIDEVLKRFGAKPKFGWVGTSSYVKRDRELISGVNGNSIDALVKAFMKQVRLWAASRAKLRLETFRSMIW